VTACGPDGAHPTPDDGPCPCGTVTVVPSSTGTAPATPGTTPTTVGTEPTTTEETSPCT